MCGIAGILTTDPWSDKLTASLTGMQAALRHRGPDDQGLWVDPAAGVGLTHTRLAILDLSPAGHQPMASADGRYQIVFNGEIYNFRELRAELELAGVVFQTGTDTEVLLRLYQKEGPAMVKQLRGMFAFAIWDGRERSAFMARDPFGIKPLYYTTSGSTLSFASELRALQKTGQAASTLNASALMGFFETGSVAEPQTLLQGVRCLPAGHHLHWKEGHIEERSYWGLRFERVETSPEEAVRITRALLLDSIGHHFVSDVPVGVFLSGGIDSTAVLALAKEANHSGLNSFSIGVDDTRLDETDVAARTALHFGTQHHVLKLNAKIAAASFPRFLAQMDQPSIDGFNTFTVAGLAHQQGMKVVLSGLGGDELFGGYPSFQKVPQLAQMARLASHVPALGFVMERLMPRQHLRRVGSLLQQQPNLLNSWRTFRGLFTRREARLLAAHYAGCELSEVPDPPQMNLPAGDELDQISACELGLYMRNQLLKDSDVMSMAHGLELRVPLVDRVLFEAVARIPSSLRLQAGKRLLTEAVPEIPAWVTNQPKKGFVFPYEKWLSTDWGSDFAEVKSRIPNSNSTWYQQWAVFMMDRWIKRT
jgi:asparagine synthase (glutamine-hydrolysing)